MWQYNYTNELYHYGVPGMKWGVRRNGGARNVTRLGRKAQIARDSAKEWDEMAGYAEAKGKMRRAAKYRSNAEHDRRDADRYDQKANAKAKRQAEIRKAVKKYNKEYDKYDELDGQAAADGLAAAEAYKQTGKTKLGRVINNMRGKSDAVKAYNKAYDKANKSQEAADAHERYMKELYKKTGKTKLSRVINTIKYRKG